MMASAWHRHAAPVVAAASIPLMALPLMAANPSDWPSQSHDPGASHRSPLTQLTPDNVASLGVAWTFDMSTLNPPGSSRLLPSSFTPLAIDGVVYLPTPYGKVLALDGATGRRLWTFAVPDGDALAGRGLAYWPGDPRSPARLFAGTRSGKVLAIDVRTGAPVPGFTPIDLKTADVMNGYPDARNVINSAPVLYDDVLITGSAVQESPALGASGDVRGWDARTGRLRWTFHAIPRAGEPGYDSWAGDSGRHRSGVNVWTLMSVDQQRGIVYLPFGSPAYDRVGIDRTGANLYANSLVAVDARTGRYLWHFQHSHHDLWDLDGVTEPTLVDVKRGTETIPAVVAMNKNSFLFILDRVTGRPLFPVTEMPVPPSTIAGEAAWPTQPMPAAPPPLSRQSMTAAEISDVTPAHHAYCLALLAETGAGFARPWEPLHADRPMVRFPGAQGGPNWGGGAFDPATGLYIVNTNQAGTIERLEQDGEGNWRNAPGPSFWFENRAARLPCHKGSWGDISAVDVSTGTVVWQMPLGITDSLPPDRQKTGRRNLGGPIITASGLIFIGAADDSRFRAFALRTGRELWTFKLPASAMATPITYLGRDGRQYVAVTAAGGSAAAAPVTASQFIVFALPKNGGTMPINARTGSIAAAATLATAASLASPNAAAPARQAAPAGRALVAKACSGCHTAAQYSGLRMTRPEWQAMVTKMIGFGANVPADKEAAIVDYLARTYPATR